MLELLGVPFIQAASEAEAMCAFLNRHHVGLNTLTLFQFVGLGFEPLCFFREYRHHSHKRLRFLLVGCGGYG